MKTEKPVATIALYGTPGTGAGFLACTGAKMLGDGEVHGRWSMTEALFLAVAALRETGLRAGLCAVHADLAAGPRTAVFDLARYTPCFGDLKWGPGWVHTISVEALLAAASEAP